MKLTGLAILLAAAVSTHAHVASMGAGGAVLGGLGLVHLGLKGAALAGVGAGLGTAAKLGILGAGLAVRSRLRRQNAEPGLVTYGGIDSITTSDGGFGEGWSNGIGDGSWGGSSSSSSSSSSSGSDSGSWGGSGGGGNSGSWGGSSGGGDSGSWGGSSGGGDSGSWNGGDWKGDSASSHGGWYIVGPPKGAPHITLLQGKLSHGGDFGGLGDGGIRRNGLGDGGYKGDKKGSYVAVNRGAIHEAPLVGHIASVKSTNLDAAPGTNY